MDTDKRQLHDDFIKIIGTGLHYYEHQNQIDLNKCTAEEINDLTEGWVERYREEPIFHAKVSSLVAQLMLRVYEIEERE